MLTLRGVVKAVTEVGGGINKRTGQVIPRRNVVQVEGLDTRGLFQLFTLTVPDLGEFEGKIGETVEVPVRAWTPDGTVHLSYETRGA